MTAGARTALTASGIFVSAVPLYFFQPFTGSFLMWVCAAAVLAASLSLLLHRSFPPAP